MWALCRDRTERREGPRAKDIDDGSVFVREAVSNQTSDHGSSHRRSYYQIIVTKNSSESEKEDHIEVDPAYESVSEDEVSSLTQYPPQVGMTSQHTAADVRSGLCPARREECRRRQERVTAWMWPYWGKGVPQRIV
ncbi:hypothetical protein EVAR_68233_1 [Eumeta japonica]|uniref:Uncharacterized protein n=1 Tax=Eumeta variegata TaxID=151549 RepID=A0A4C2ACS6_EUMVA|nr:hypothetical protein EVAR_68233_1 [Eumeta japonica]